jgi:hypothetical protein
MFEFIRALPLVLADQIGQYITLAVLVLTFLSWFVKLLKGDGGAAAQAAPPRPREKELRTEIEVFLQELTKPEPPKPAAPARPPAPPRKPAPPLKTKAEKPRKARLGDAPPKKTERQRPGSTLAQQHLPSGQLGQGVRAHVSEYMTSDRVTAEAQQHVGHRIEQAVEYDLGVSAAMTNPPRMPVVKHPLVALLSEPGGARQAFVLNEVLQKPRALRHS